MAIVRVTLEREGNSCVVPVPFDPRVELGRANAPVKVTLNGYTYRSTIASMGGCYLIPLRRSHREAAGLAGDETLEVEIQLDEDPRDIEVPAELEAALRAAPGAWDRWQRLSYTHRREHVEAIAGAKRPETRVRRIAAAVRAAATPASKDSPPS